MATPETVERYNRILLRKMSVFLNYEPDFIQPDMLRELCGECGLSETEAFSMILASAVRLETDRKPEDKELYSLYFPLMVHHLEPSEFTGNPYLREIRIPPRRAGEWEFRQEHYKPCEAFACDDLLSLPDGRIIPQIGFFSEEFRYPAVLENGREWMLITPNEIRTMTEPVRRARGRVLTFGLGLGYFAFMAARKREVLSVTVVEKDPAVIELFERYLQPQMSCADKITVIRDDAFTFAEERMAAGGFDVVFADIWHDPSDGIPAYRRFKKAEHLLPGAEFLYWIEPTMRCYL